MRIACRFVRSRLIFEGPCFMLDLSKRYSTEYGNPNRCGFLTFSFVWTPVMADAGRTDLSFCCIFWEQKAPRFSWGFLLLYCLQPLLQVGQNICNVFGADRQADGRRRDAAGTQFVLFHLGMGGRRRMDDQALDIGHIGQ